MTTTIDTLQEALKYFEEPSRGPVPKDIYKAQYWEMAGAHAFLVNALLHLYEQATSITENKQQDFIGYALQWTAALDHHHSWEENIYYPLFNPKFQTSTIVAEHETFHAGTVAFEDYLVSCLPVGTKYGYGSTAGAHDVQKYDGNRFRSLIDAFVGPLTTHLKQEITYLEPDKIRASGLTEAEMKHISETSEKHMKSMPPFTFLVYTILHTPRSSGFPPVPGFVRNVLVPYVFTLPNRRYWQFAPKH